MKDRKKRIFSPAPDPFWIELRMKNNKLVGKYDPTRHLLEIKVNKVNALTSQIQNKSFALLSEDEMALVLAHRAKRLRLQKNIKQKELGKMANLSSATTYSNFEQTGKISLINFLKVLRALGRIPEAEELLKLSLSDTINTYEDETLISKKRVRK